MKLKKILVVVLVLLSFAACSDNKGDDGVVTDLGGKPGDDGGNKVPGDEGEIPPVEDDTSVPEDVGDDDGNTNIDCAQPTSFDVRLNQPAGPNYVGTPYHFQAEVFKNGSRVNQPDERFSFSWTINSESMPGATGEALDHAFTNARNYKVIVEVKFCGGIATGTGKTIIAVIDQPSSGNDTGTSACPSVQPAIDIRLAAEPQFISAAQNVAFTVSDLIINGSPPTPKQLRRLTYFWKWNNIEILNAHASTLTQRVSSSGTMKVKVKYCGFESAELPSYITLTAPPPPSSPPPPDCTPSPIRVEFPTSAQTIVVGERSMLNATVHVASSEVASRLLYEWRDNGQMRIASTELLGLTLAYNQPGPHTISLTASYCGESGSANTLVTVVPKLDIAGTLGRMGSATLETECAVPATYTDDRQTVPIVLTVEGRLQTSNSRLRRFSHVKRYFAHGVKHMGRMTDVETVKLYKGPNYCEGDWVQVFTEKGFKGSSSMCTVYSSECMARPFASFKIHRGAGCTAPTACAESMVQNDPIRWPYRMPFIVKLYEDNYYRNDFVHILKTESALSSLGFNDTASSLQKLQGPDYYDNTSEYWNVSFWNVKECQGIFGFDMSICFGTPCSNGDLEDWWNPAYELEDNDVMSSVKIGPNSSVEGCN